MSESFYREDSIEVRASVLPAELYNLSRLLLARGGADCLFVPIRSIQYLAVIDAEEIIFVDREAKQLVELAWREFRPQARQCLTEPVAYEIHLYLDKGREILPRLQGEFFKALREMEQRTAPGTRDAPQILPFPGARDRDSNK